MSTIVELIARLGAQVIDNVTALGNFVLFLATALWCAITPPYKPRLTIRQMRSIGAESIMLVALIGAFTGASVRRAHWARWSRWCSCASWAPCWRR